MNGAIPRKQAHLFCPLVKYFLISTQTNSISFAFPLLGRGKDGFYSTLILEQSLKFEIQTKVFEIQTKVSQMDLVPKSAQTLN